MAGAGYTLFVAGQVLTAAQVNTYLEQQSVMAFASAAAGDTALSSVKAEMMHRTLLDTNCDQVYSGSAWSSMGPVHGALITWAPVVVQSNTPTLTLNLGTYSRVGRRITFDAVVTITSAGTAANTVTISLPVAAKAGYSIYSIVGRGSLADTSASLFYQGDIRIASTTTVTIDAGNSTAPLSLGSSSFTAALANGDIISISGSYEAGADA